MKKVFLSGFLLAAALPFVTHAETSGFYIGGGIGLYDAKFKNGEIGFIEEPDYAGDKKNLSNSGFGGSLFVGKLFEGSKVDWFVQGGVSFDTLDFSTEFNPGQQNDLIATTGLRTKVKRAYALDLTTGISKSFSHGLRASLNLGILLSRFNVKFIETPSNNAGRLERAEYAWGIAPGVSIEKTVGPVSLGLSYSYQIFENLKSTMGNHSATGATLRCSLKQTPVYQVLMLNVKKMF